MLRHVDERCQSGQGIRRQYGVHRESGPPRLCQRPLGRPAGASSNGSSARNRERESIAQAGPAPEFGDRRNGSDRPDWTALVFRDPSKADRQVLRCFQRCFYRPASQAFFEAPLRPLLVAIPMKQADTVAPALLVNSWE